MPANETFGNLSGEYDDWFDEHDTLYQQELSAIKELLPEFKNGLEVGAGTGRFGPSLGITSGVEPCPEMGALAEKKGMRIIKAAAEALPFENNSFDLLLMVTVLCFFDDPAKALSEAAGVLQPDGYLLTAFIDRSSPLGLKYDANKADSRFYKEARFLSTAEMTALLKQSGFTELTYRQVAFIDGTDMPAREGFGEGGFVVIRSKKRR